MDSSTEVLSNWSTLIENFQASPQKFYEAVTKALDKRQMPGATVSRMNLKEGSVFSASREYLRISCKKDFYFAICGAPVWNGVFCFVVAPAASERLSGTDVPAPCGGGETLDILSHRYGYYVSDSNPSGGARGCR